MIVQPIRYTADVAALTRFYEVLGLAVGDRTRTGGWQELPGTGGQVAVHLAGGGSAPGTCELSFETGEPLDAVRQRLADAGYEVEAVVDESFGYSLGVRDPDGVRVQINASDRELWT